MIITNAVRNPGNISLPIAIQTSANELGLQLASNLDEPFTICPNDSRGWVFEVLVNTNVDLTEVPAVFNGIPVVTSLDDANHFALNQQQQQDLSTSFGEQLVKSLKTQPFISNLEIIDGKWAFHVTVKDPKDQDTVQETFNDIPVIVRVDPSIGLR